MKDKPKQKQVDRDAELRAIAIYDVSRGNIFVAKEAAVWRRFAYFKRRIALGEFGNRSALEALRKQVLSNFSVGNKVSDDEQIGRLLVEADKIYEKIRTK
jgi:hypothetical protein